MIATFHIFTEQGIKQQSAVRFAVLWNLRKTEGMTFGQIAESLQICRQAAQTAFRNADRLVKSYTNANKPWHYGLSVRATNVLTVDGQNRYSLSGIEQSKAAIRTAVISGRLVFRRLRNCGKYTEKEILTWIGVESVKA